MHMSPGGPMDAGTCLLSRVENPGLGKYRSETSSCMLQTGLPWVIHRPCKSLQTPLKEKTNLWESPDHGDSAGQPPHSASPELILPRGWWGLPLSKRRVCVKRHSDLDMVSHLLMFTTTDELSGIRTASQPIFLSRKAIRPNSMALIFRVLLYLSCSCPIHSSEVVSSWRCTPQPLWDASIKREECCWSALVLGDPEL